MGLGFRWLVFALVVGATATSAFGQYSATYLAYNGWTEDITNISVLQDGATDYIRSGDIAFSNDVTPINVVGGTGSFSSILIGLINGVPGDDDSDHIVIFMNSAVAHQLVADGIGWDGLFAGHLDEFSEAGLASYLRQATAGNAAAQGRISYFASTLLTSISSNNSSAWFDGSGPMTAVKFSLPAEAVPEPMTMALIGLAPIAYLRRRKAARAA